MFHKQKLRLKAFHTRAKRISRALAALKKNAAHFLPFYHKYNAYLFDRRYKKGLAPWSEISDGLFGWLSALREEALVLAPGGRILEIGCGDGKLTSRLAGNSREVIGLDISEEAIRRARKHELGNVRFLVHDIERDPLEEANSVIICEDILYYIPFVSMKKVAKKLSDALILGGILLVIDYLPGYMETRYYYRLLSRFLTPIRIEPITYSPESARFMIALYRKG